MCRHLPVVVALATSWRRSINRTTLAQRAEHYQTVPPFLQLLPVALACVKLSDEQSRQPGIGNPARILPQLGPALVSLAHRFPAFACQAGPRLSIATKPSAHCRLAPLSVSVTS